MPRVVLAKPMIRHERAAVLREIFDSLDDGDFQISRAEYVRLMGTRGVSAEEASATFSDMDHNGSNMMWTRAPASGIAAACINESS